MNTLDHLLGPDGGSAALGDSSSAIQPTSPAVDRTRRVMQEIDSVLDPSNAISDRSSTLGVDPDDVSLSRQPGSHNRPTRREIITGLSSAVKSTSPRTVIPGAPGSQDKTYRPPKSQAFSPDAPARHRTMIVVVDERPATAPTPVAIRSAAIAQALQRQGFETIVCQTPNSFAPQLLHSLQASGVKVVERAADESPASTLKRLLAGARYRVAGVFVPEPSAVTKDLGEVFGEDLPPVVVDMTRVQQEILQHSTRTTSQLFNAGDLAMRHGVLVPDTKMYAEVLKTVTEIVAARKNLPKFLTDIQGPDGLRIRPLLGGNKIRQVTEGFPNAKEEDAFDQIICECLEVPVFDRVLRLQIVERTQSRDVNRGTNLPEYKANPTPGVDQAALPQNNSYGLIG